MPEFECDIDPLTLSKLSDADRLLAISLSKLRQEVRWVGTKTILAHNISVQNAKFISKFSGPITFLVFVLTAALGAAIVKMVDKIIK